MKKPASLLGNKNKFLILGCGFSGSFFAKTIRKFGCTVLTSSRSEKKIQIVLFSTVKTVLFLMKKFLMESHIFLVAYLPTKMEMIQY